MDRLTFDGNFCDIAQCLEMRGGKHCPDGYCSQRRVWERLKEYEDTGMAPKEVSEFASPEVVEVARLLSNMFDEGSAQHMVELFEAEKDGRLALLPAKTVFELTWYATQKCDFICPRFIENYDSCDGCNKAEPHIRECRFRQEHIPLIGKTVFLTREEAESALSGRRSKDDVSD